MKDNSSHDRNAEKRLPLAADEDPPHHREARPEVRIAINYLVAASAWVIGSDLLLTRTQNFDIQSGLLQSLKGLNFVLTTAVLLFFVLRKAYGGWRKAEKRRLAVIEQAGERFRSLSAHIVTLREEDRSRIAREIHDELGQILTGIKIEVRSVENNLSDRDDRALNPLIDRLVEAAEMVDEAITAVRRISAGLRPVALDHLGLGPALKEEGDQFTERTGIPCSMVIDGLEETLPPEVTTTVFRIFQEALTNIVRHANATLVTARMTLTGDHLRLVVADDGIGINPSAMADQKSLGLVGMLERAHNVGGKLEFRSGVTSGTELDLSIPLTESPIPTWQEQVNF